MKFILLITSLFFVSDAVSCSCAEWENAREMMKNADTVVLAVPTDNGSFFSSGEFAPMYKTGMKIVKHYKGDYKKFFYLLTEKDTGANCGVNFKKYDGMYLIFGFKYNSKYYATSMCDMTPVSPEYPEILEYINQLEN